jgi:hypothetical protein
VMDNNVVTAFHQVKYHPNVISTKVYSAGWYLAVCPHWKYLWWSIKPPRIQTLCKSSNGFGKVHG